MQAIDIYIKVFVFFLVVVFFILLRAYLEVRSQMIWYKKQFHKQPRAFRLVEKDRWPQRVIDTLLTISPIKQKSAL